MKKVCAILLAVLMLLTVVPMAAFARVPNNDKIMDEILNGDFEHMAYTKDNNYFKSGLIAYSVFHANTWGDQIKGDTMEAKAAKTILLALIDKIEAELNNETYEKILSVLKGAKTGMELVEKVNQVTGKLDFVASEGWGTAFTVLNNVVKWGSIANDEYEKYAEGYAVILSCQAASSYYGGLLDYIAENVEDENIANAAAELKEYITMSIDDANKLLMEQIADDVGQQAALTAIDVAMNTNTVTAAIRTGYGVITSIGDKLFNATDTCTYMSALAAVTRIEDVVPTYVSTEITSEDPLAVDFAKVALVSLREAGETLLSNLGKVTADSIVAKVFKNADQAQELSKAGALEALKLRAYKDIIVADGEYTTNEVIISVEPRKNATVYDAEGNEVAFLKNGKESSKIDENGAFFCIYDGTLNVYAKVIVTFGENYEVTYSDSSSSSSSSSSTSSGKKSGGFFASFFAAIAEFFRSLFSFGKK